MNIPNPYSSLFADFAAWAQGRLGEEAKVSIKQDGEELTLAIEPNSLEHCSFIAIARKAMVVCYGKHFTVSFEEPLYDEKWSAFFTENDTFDGLVRLLLPAIGGDIRVENCLNKQGKVLLTEFVLMSEGKRYSRKTYKSWLALFQKIDTKQIRKFEPYPSAARFIV